MNITKKSEAIKLASTSIRNKTESELNSIYMKAYHEGRHDLRDKYKDYLIIDPSKEELLKKYSQDPCIGCINSSSHNALRCLIDPKSCFDKQNQLLALEIIENFK